MSVTPVRGPARRSASSPSPVPAEEGDAFTRVGRLLAAAIAIGMLVGAFAGILTFVGGLTAFAALAATHARGRR